MLFNIKIGSPFLIAASAFVFSGCLVESQPRKFAKEEPAPTQEPAPISCTNSTLCRVDTPADTSLLTQDQKEELVEVIEGADDSAVVSITTLDLAPLVTSNPSPEAVKVEVFKVLQTDALKELQAPLDSVLSSGIPLESLISSVGDVIVSPVVIDTSTNLQWSGTIAGVQVDQVSMNVKNGQFLGGYAVVGGKVFTFTSLGGNIIAVVYDSKLVWKLNVDACPNIAQVPSSQLLCSLFIP